MDAIPVDDAEESVEESELAPSLEYGEEATADGSPETDEEQPPGKASLAIWGIPSLIESGTTFSILVGGKCSSGIPLSGEQIRIYDAEGVEQGTASLSDALFSEDVSLYWAEVELTAPDEATHCIWEARIEENRLTDSGEASSVQGTYVSAVQRFSFNTAKAAEHKVVIEVVDEDERTGLDRVRVMMRPYSGHTDANGRLELMVAGGEYTLTTRLNLFENHSETLVIDSDIEHRVILEHTEFEEDYRGNRYPVQKKKL